MQKADQVTQPCWHTAVLLQLVQLFSAGKQIPCTNSGQHCCVMSCLTHGTHNLQMIVLCDIKTDNVLVGASGKMLHTDFNGVVEVGESILKGLGTVCANLTPEKAAASRLGVPLPATPAVCCRQCIMMLVGFLQVQADRTVI